MAGDRGLAFVIIGLIGISLGWIVDARAPKKVAKTATAPTALVAKPIPVPQRALWPETYLNSELRRFPAATLYQRGRASLVSLPEHQRVQDFDSMTGDLDLARPDFARPEFARPFE